MKLDVNYSLCRGTFNSRMCFRLFEPRAGVFGPSGAGKSTLFQALAGLIRPDTGHIKLDDEILFQADARIFVPPHKRRIGLVFQNARLFPHWSVEQNLRAGERLCSKEHACPYTFDDVVQLLAVNDLLSRSVTTLSGGEQQRIALGRALLSNPRLLLMDEPVTGLDDRLKAQILPFLVQVSDAFNIPCIYISHDLSELQQLTDYLILIRDGENKQQGPISELIKQPGIVKHFVGASLLNILKLSIRSHDEKDGITQLTDLDNTSEQIVYSELWNDLEHRAHVTVSLAPTAIALAQHPIEYSSIQNQWPGQVEQIIHAPDRSLCIVETALGRLMVDIVPRSERQLDLHPGKEIFCLIKAKALQRI